MVAYEPTINESGVDEVVRDAHAPAKSRDLVITTYVDCDPVDFEIRSEEAVPAALNAAAQRVSEPRTPSATNAIGGGIVVQGGLDLLNGAGIRWAGVRRLTTVTVTVPWRANDGIDGKKLLAANRFAQVFSAEVCAAA